MAKKIAIDIDIKGTKDVIDIREALKETNKQIKIAKKQGDIETFDRLAKDVVRLKSELKDATKRQRQAVDAFTATDKTVGGYNRLNAQLRVSKRRLKDLAAEGQTTGKEVDELTKEVNQLDATLKDIDQSVGETNRKVGAYEEAIRKATGLTEKQTGAFSRMNGKLNVLKKSYKDVVIAQGSTSKGAKELRKEIDKLERTLKQAGNTGQKAGKRIGGIRTQLRGLGGPLAGLASGFLIFSELPQALGEINEGLSNFAAFISPAEALNRAFSESIREGAQQLVEEQSLLDFRLDAITDSAEGTQEHNDAIALAVEEYGPYLSDLAKEELLLGNVALAQKEVTEALIADIAAQQKAAQRVKLIEGVADATAKGIATAAEAETTFGKLRNTVTGGLLDITGVTALAQFAGLGDDFTEISQQITSTDKANKLEQLRNLDQFEEDLKEGLSEVSDVLREDIGNTSAIVQAGEDERNRAQLERARKQAERLAKQRAANQERFLQQELKDANRRADLLLSLSEKLVTAQLNNLENGVEKSVKLEQDASQRRINNLENQNQAFEEKAKERIEKVNALFGEGSKQAIELEEKLGLEQLQIRGQIDALIEQEEISSLKRIEDIRNDFASREAEERKKTLKANLDVIKAAAQKVVDAKKKENEELERLEQERKEAIQKNTQFALETTAKIIGAIDQVAQASSEKRIKRVEEDEAERAQNIENLQASLQSASGLEAAFLQQQIDQETKAAEQLAAKKERIEKDAAINNKAIALLQAGINVSLGVTNALASLPPPFSFITAGITAALGAAEIISIATTPLAKGGLIEETFARGGMVDGPSHARGGVKFAVGGQVKELEGGEAVINKRSTSMFRPQLSAMNVAGGGVPFANGGVISPPMGAPSLPALQSDANNSMSLIQSNQATINELKNSLMRMEVVYTTNTADAIQNDETDKKEIKERATL